MTETEYFMTTMCDCIYVEQLYHDNKIHDIKNNNNDIHYCYLLSSIMITIYIILRMTTTLLLFPVIETGVESGIDDVSDSESDADNGSVERARTAWNTSVGHTRVTMDEINRRYKISDSYLLNFYTCALHLNNKHDIN